MNLANYQIWQGKKTRELYENLSDQEFTQKLDEPLKPIDELTIHVIMALESCFARRDKKRDQLENIWQEVKSLSKNELMSRWEELDYRLHEAIMNREKDEILIIEGIHPESYIMPELDFYLQYIMHTSYHRSQIMYSLRALGKETKTLDYLLYFGDK